MGFTMINQIGRILNAHEATHFGTQTNSAALRLISATRSGPVDGRTFFPHPTSMSNTLEYLQFSIIHLLFYPSQLPFFPLLFLRVRLHDLINALQSLTILFPPSFHLGCSQGT